MRKNEKILSIRIVSVDFYIQRPVKDFDICYSKFRGASIKKVPVIRLFGSTHDGDKLCCHIHGVFPYIYIPFEGGNEENFLYQLASSLDKAINISQGQTNSTNQHVVKIQIVRGTPIYGYHAYDHQYLKVYFYNPGIVRRAANLLQNGAILGKVYQPHECHVPYILQFFIDFNLYGMSFLNVLKECIVYRSENALQKHLKKVSTCDTEIDIFATTILNGKIGFNSSEQHSNPGIAALWVDERFRRNLHIFEENEKVPALESLLHRLSGSKAKATESDLFYQKGLMAKLNQSETSGEAKQLKDKKFNLLAILKNSVYPAECSEEQKVSLDASNVYLSGSTEQSVTAKTKISSINVNESLALTSSQSVLNLSFKAEDADLLAIMNHLEVESSHIEDDSLLGALTQSIKTPVVVDDAEPETACKIVLQNVSGCSDDEDDLINFTLPLQVSLDTDDADDENGTDVDATDDSERTIRAQEFTVTGIERITNLRRQKSNMKITSLQQLKAEDVKYIKNFEVTDELMAEIISNPPTLCLTKASFEKLNAGHIETTSHQYDLLKNFIPSQGPSDKWTKPNHANIEKSVNSNQNLEEHDINASANQRPLDKKSVLITSVALPPSPSDISSILAKYDVSEIPKERVFFSDIADVRSKKEVGHIVLHIPSNKLMDAEPHISLLSDLFTIDKIRQTIINNLNQKIKNHEYDERIEQISNKEQTLKFSVNVKNFKTLLGSDAKCLICPSQQPPTSNEAMLWYKQNFKVLEKSSNDCGAEDVNEKIFERDKNKITTSITTSWSSHTDLSSTDCSEQKQLLALDMPLDKTYFKQAKADLRLRRNFGEKSSDSSDSSNVTLTQSISEIKLLRRKSMQSQTETILSNDDTQESLTKQTSHSKSFSKYINLTADEHSSADLSCATLENTYGFKMNLENLQSVKADIEHNFLTVLSVEVHVQTRDKLKPDPDVDAITAIFYSIFNDVPESSREPTADHGMIVNREMLSGEEHFKNCRKNTFRVTMAENESDLLEKLHQLVSLWDPDIFTGYEIEMHSWGYLLQRGSTIGINLKKLLSRIPSEKVQDYNAESGEQEGDFVEFNVEISITGRILLDIWRLLRHEIALTSYTFENCTYHILHQRYPLYSFKHLTNLWVSFHTIDIVIDYYMRRANGNLELLKHLDLVGRTCELAKLFGIQFYEVLSRGSQFRVESMMLRIAKPRNLVSLSPSVAQRAHMRAPEHIPLILEPESRMYLEPLIVLDFQSLYPSIIIAYNYCFSTCLGRVEHLGNAQPFEFGASQLKISPKITKQLLDSGQITVSPCGVVFVKSSVREGVLPRMLEEILETRLMVKQSMKLYKNNNALQRVLHSRQLGLKLIANVTYGYTAANFSGRMPCVEVGDSVVSKGKETLERAIKLVETTEKWKAKVVYGDTDSLFVLTPGRNREEAFRIGAEIASAVTSDNPSPIKLKLEKVYQPSILQTKKRYVGYMYESADQQEPKYEAKGIETVRRDGCPAVAKMLEKTIRILFDTKDVSAVKDYVCRQFTKILTDKVNMRDLIFAKEFRGINGYKPGACVPSLELARKWLKTDKRAEPRRGERVPFIIVNGAAGLPLIKLVKSPHEVLHNEGLKINAIYYITKAIIPPLNRCLYLIGADVNEWFDKLPRKSIELQYHTGNMDLAITNWITNKKSTVSQYFSTKKCAANCGNETLTGLCAQCRVSPQETILELSNKINKADRRLFAVKKICQVCCDSFDDINCVSIDCPVLFVVDKCEKKYKQTLFLKELSDEYF